MSLNDQIAVWIIGINVVCIIGCVNDTAANFDSGACVNIWAINTRSLCLCVWQLCCLLGYALGLQKPYIFLA